MATKEIYLHIYKTGRLRRWAYYEDFRAASCAYGLLKEWGWDVGEIRYLDQVNKYKVFAQAVNHKPTVDKNTFVAKGNEHLSKLRALVKSRLISRRKGV